MSLLKSTHFIWCTISVVSAMDINDFCSMASHAYIVDPLTETPLLKILHLPLKQGVNETRVNLMLGLRHCNCWKISLHCLCNLQALADEVHPVLQAVRLDLYIIDWNYREAFTIMHSSKELVKQFIQLTRKIYLHWWRTHGNLMFCFQDLAGTDTGTYTMNKTENV